MKCLDLSCLTPDLLGIEIFRKNLYFVGFGWITINL